MSPDAKSGALLYVSDWNANVVDVYSYPGLKRVGQLTDDMLNPDGLCTDAKGDIFVVNNTPNADDVLEFAHGDTTPIQTLGNPGQVGVGCSVDPVTGNLAVTNVEALYYGLGSVSIYTKATGNPTMYSDPDMGSVYFCGYDARAICTSMASRAARARGRSNSPNCPRASRPSNRSSSKGRRSIFPATSSGTASTSTWEIKSIRKTATL